VAELTPAVLSHRVNMILELGFEPDQAVLLAEARDSRGYLLDIHDLRRVVRAGCSLEQAFAIYA
jgi:hypothetical protein